MIVYPRKGAILRYRAADPCVLCLATIQQLDRLHWCTWDRRWTTTISSGHDDRLVHIWEPRSAPFGASRSTDGLSFPPGFEEIFEVVGEKPPDVYPPPTEPDLAAMAAVAEDFGFEILGPPRWIEDQEDRPRVYVQRLSTNELFSSQSG